MRIRIALLTVFVLTCQSILAQNRPFFTSLGTREGLPNSAVASIVQDEKGFMWFGTQGGLVRYDGYSFKLYENTPFEKNTLSHDQIQTLYMDKTVLWIGTYGGLNRLDLTTNILTSYKHDPSRADSLKGDLVVSIARDVKGRLWVGTSKGLDLMDEERGVFTHFGPRDDGKGLPEGMIRDIHLDSRGVMWVATSGMGLYRHDDTDDTFFSVRIDPKDPSTLSSAFVMSISESPDGTLWFASWAGGLSVLEDRDALRFRNIPIPDDRLYFVNAQSGSDIYTGTWGGGLYVYSRVSGKVEHIKHADGAGSIPNDVVYSAFLDSNSVFWIGTNGGGLARSERRDAKYKLYVHDDSNPESLSLGKVTSVLEDSQGALWVGVYSGGLSRLDRATGTFDHYRHDPKNPKSIPNDIVNYLYEDSFGELWIGTNAGVARYDRKTGTFTSYKNDPDDLSSIADNVTYTMVEAPDGNLWIGTYTKGLDLFVRETGTFQHFPPDPAVDNSPQDALVYALAYDGAGNLWIGYNNGLDRYEKDKFVHYRYDPEKRTGISSNTIRQIFLDSHSRLWLGSVGGGLMRYDSVTDTFSHLTKKEGLPHNTVRSILEADDGNLWIGTAKGIGVIDRTGGSVKGYSVYNDLKDRDFHTGAWKTKDGYLFLGGQNTLYQLDPRDEISKRPVPRLLVSELLINGKPLPVSEKTRSSAYTGELFLEYNANNISFSFATVDFRDPARNLYSYYLEGFDKDWSSPTNQHTATYTNLPGGTYTLRVRASDNEGYWNYEALTLPIYVGSPPWLTVPAFIAYFCVLVALGYLIASLRGKSELKAKIIELTLVQGELEKANIRLDELSMQDGLTGIANRRRLDELLPRYVAESAREKHPLTFIMLDIDFFKGFNDCYGHLKGDEALKQIASTLLSCTERATDLVARYGGEEFAVVLPNTDRSGAQLIAERILATVRELYIPNIASTACEWVTVSAGIASFVPDPGDEGVKFIDFADMALYRAKSNGRNQFA